MSKRMVAAVWVMLASVAYTFAVGTWPEIYTFATDSSASLVSRLTSAPIHLSDDVMIALRTGQVLLETGIPSFNHVDLAQASTSYVTPYLFAGLDAVLTSSLAVGAFALLGLAAATFTLGALVYFAKSTLNGTLLALALALTQTHVTYALNGWDHIFQAFAFVAAMVLMLPAASTRRLIAGSVLLAFGSLLRPDGILIALAILYVAVKKSPDRRRAAVVATGTLAAVLGAALAINQLQFGYLTPTTTRLKFGAAPELSYMLDQVADASARSFTALTVLFLLMAFIALYWRVLPMSTLWPFLVGATTTAALAIYNSDVFAGGRMYWVAAVVLGLAVVMEAPAFLTLGRAYVGQPFTWAHGRATSTPALILISTVTLALLVGVVSTGMSGLRTAVVAKEEVQPVGTTGQFVLAEWINANLKPSNGAIGVFFAGVSYHLSQFEIADFLGKGDELIANAPAKTGPPGHNKWDFEQSVEKWHPQAILPAHVIDMSTVEGRRYAEMWKSEKWDHEYIADLFLDEAIASQYRLCYVRDIRHESSSEFGLLLRLDIASRLGDQIHCPATDQPR